MALFLVRFGEIGVKSPPVRRRFSAKLADNIRAGLSRAGVEGTVEREWARLYVESEDPDGVADVLSRTFGIVSFSEVHLAEADPDKIADRAVQLLEERVPDGDIGRFAVRPRRHGEHDFSSRDVGVVVGAAVEEAFDAPVDLDDPDTEVFVEVRDNSAYVFFDKPDGPGGLPVAVQGKVALAWGPGAALAGWLLLKRGVSLYPVVPEGRSDEVKVLAPWAPGLKAIVVGDDVEGPGAWLSVVDRAGTDRGCDALAVGYRLTEGFAERYRTLRSVTHLPLLSPLTGLTDGERADLATRLGVDDEAGVAPEVETPLIEPDVETREVEL